MAERISTHGLHEAPLPPWALRPAHHLLFALLALGVLAYAVGIDRTYLIDQQNYVDNFTEAASLQWLTSLSEETSLLRAFVIEFFSEELLWRLWASLLGSFFSPATAVAITVAALNLLVVASTWRLPMPTLGMALWIVLPVAFAVTGLLQLRQGFAFAVVLFCGLLWQRPLLGAFVGGMIHTTFAVAFVFAAIGRILRSRPRLALLATVLTAFAGAWSGRVLFDAFGGRRLLTYSVQEGVTSITYVLTGLLCIVPSVYWLLTREARDEEPVRRTTTSFALMHVGSTAFTIFSFFLFPIGAGRVGYLTQLLLIPILPHLRRDRPLAIVILGLIFLYLLYLTGKSYFEGVYDVYLGG